jgi:hypothetical protein
VFLEPPSIDDRIVNQFALFSLMSTPTQAMDIWLAAHADVSRKIIIPASLKWEVRDKLDQAGITERVLFPGLDGLTTWLTRYYTPHCGDSADDNVSGKRQTGADTRSNDYIAQEMHPKNNSGESNTKRAEQKSRHPERIKESERHRERERRN